MIKLLNFKLRFRAPTAIELARARF